MGVAAKGAVQEEDSFATAMAEADVGTVPARRPAEQRSP